MLESAASIRLAVFSPFIHDAGFEVEVQTRGPVGRTALVTALKERQYVNTYLRELAGAGETIHVVPSYFLVRLTMGR